MAMYFPDLIEEYKQSLKELKVVGGCLSMIKDMQEAIKWMETGYDPAEYRAATRTDVYVMDHHLMQDLITYVDSDKMTPSVLAEVIDCSYDNSVVKEIEKMFNVKDIANQAMAGLTENERTAFIMIRAEQMTFSKAAKILGVSRGTVQNYVKRAESKIANNIRKEKLFLFAV
ncbi:sigma factor-like helix-turn-helix DNA-binding protein [Lysinibacillus sp. ACHW1.5]|uniref:sigma factor-like helix-turn-helix DNA-binding protein n=1 Tax=Lysinibacillus sp. ACHW1.5 TaxID=2913506 RepID=UPI001EDB64BC|nr:sigma factor-like helix-turn-helix DNA-binding protein [Lysinibacillus sp. ACHW1.5]UKJ43470.1 DUF134 domain-containing protein [Lysinibacillus sp. ACHW1.5]